MRYPQELLDPQRAPAAQPTVLVGVMGGIVALLRAETGALVWRRKVAPQKHDLALDDGWIDAAEEGVEPPTTVDVAPAHAGKRANWVAPPAFRATITPARAPATSFARSA